MTGTFFFSIFPPFDLIPEKYRTKSPIEQRQYFCDGGVSGGPGMRLYDEEQFGPVVPVAALRIRKSRFLSMDFIL